MSHQGCRAGSCARRCSRYQPSVTWIIVLPDTRGASGPNAAGASANCRTAPTFEVRRPSRSSWAISASWGRSASTTKKTARPFSGWNAGVLAMVTIVRPALRAHSNAGGCHPRSHRAPHQPRPHPLGGHAPSPRIRRRQDRARGLCRRPCRFRSLESQPDAQAARRSNRPRLRRRGSARFARRAGGRGRTGPAMPSSPRSPHPRRRHDQRLPATAQGCAPPSQRTPPASRCGTSRPARTPAARRSRRWSDSPARRQRPTSCPGTLGVRSRPPRSVRVPDQASSPRVKPAACTRTMTSFSAACGYGRSVRDSPARPASRSWTAMACIAVSSLLRNIPSRWVQQVEYECRCCADQPATNREGPPSTPKSAKLCSPTYTPASGTQAREKLTRTVATW